MRQSVWKQDTFAAELKKTLEERKVTSIMLVCGNSFRRQELYEQLGKLADQQGCSLTEFSDFEPNPDYCSVVKGVQVFLDNRCDFLIAAGGGSALDVAKCIKLFSNMDHGRNYLEQEIVEQELPFLAIPTTAGTGSEATRFAVIYYQGEKQSVNHLSCIPEYVLLDAELLDTLPLYQKKVTMLDAFCHAVESFWSVNSTEESKEYAADAIRLLLEWKDLYLKNDRHGNEQMLLAANLAGKAINLTQTTAGHAMAYKLTTLYGLPHGHATALCVNVLFPFMVNDPGKCTDPRGSAYLSGVFMEIAKAMGCNTVEAAICKFHGMLKELEIMAPAMNDEQELNVLKRSVNIERLKNHPICLDEQTLEGLYRKILTNA
ncbi:MAG: phosphonoacetaldehyde reductase [Lachnospiraceae bacterium]|nr:phosphonoacetaldehyde reductase [Lachnospiraceae bacterium]